MLGPHKPLRAAPEQTQRAARAGPGGAIDMPSDDGNRGFTGPDFVLLFCFFNFRAGTSARSLRSVTLCLKLLYNTRRTAPTTGIVLRVKWSVPTKHVLG